MTGDRKGCGALALMVAITFLLLGPLNAIHAHQVLGGPEVGPRSEWREMATLSREVEILPGHQFYLAFDPESQSFEPMDLPPKDAGFSSVTKDAIDAVPGWIRTNLTAKFAQISDVPISLGAFSSPAVEDLDGDGDLDLVIGDDTGVRFYDNVGTSEWPVYVSEPGISLVGDFFGDPQQGGLGRWAPAIADLNRDQYPDLILGNGDGTLYVYENVPGSAFVTFEGPFPLSTIDVGSNSHPELGDLDDDGDPDLVVGNDRGTLSYYENTGTNGSYDFTLRPMRFQGIEVGADSTPALGDLDGDGDLDLTLGSASSGLFHYSNVGGAFVLDVSVYAGVAVGDGSSPMLADLYPDRLLDIYVGTQEGRVLYLDNIGRSDDPQWKTWSSFDLFGGVAYYPRDEFLKVRTHGVADRYAMLILQSADIIRDEIGFSVANTAPEILRALNDTQAQVLVENAEYIYTIDEFIDYADLVEKGDHTTIRYRTEVDGQVVEREYPRDIYYWFVVHPQITDEVARYVDPETGGALDPDHGGRFWREYLFFHADDSYPSGPGEYPDTEPPLLKDLVGNMDVLWNDTKWNAPGGRDQYYGGHGLIRVANWVGKTLIINQQESGDGERPIQPVRIAHHHNGNCGELQDLTVAAARTALIPAKGVSMPGEDHVWIEYYENGWHQWDNYWSDGGAIIDNYMTYWEGWGERGGGGIFAWSGNDATWEVTRKYVDPADISKVTFTVKDRNGDPVDGARIVVASHWLLQSDTEPVEVTIPFPSIFNYTDHDGISTLFLAAQKDVRDANYNFSFKVISRIGQAEQGKTELEQGEDRSFEFVLEGTVPQAQLRIDVQPISEESELRLEVDCIEGPGLQLPFNPVDGRTQPVVVPPRRGDTGGEGSGPILAFVVDEADLDLYLKGQRFVGLGVINGPGGAIDLPVNRSSYLVFSTEGAVESSRSFTFNATVHGLLRSPDLTIVSPTEGTLFPKGDLVNVTGTVGDPYGIEKLEISTDGGGLFKDISVSIVNDTWLYSYYTAGEPIGTCNIRVRATNGLDMTTERQVNITLEALDLERPSVSITEPDNGRTVDEGDVVRIRGTAFDNAKVSYLGLSLNDGGSWMDITDSLISGRWGHDWDTRGKPAGDYTIISRAVDPSGNEATDKVRITISGGEGDDQRPSVTITGPGSDETFTVGSTVRIEGTATDNVGIAKLGLKIGGGAERDITHRLDSGKWHYDWSTEAEGEFKVTVTATDSASNVDTDRTFINIIEDTGGNGGPDIPGNGPLKDTTTPTIDIFEPVWGTKIRKGQPILIYGRAQDDSGIVFVQLGVDGGMENITRDLQAGYFSVSIPTSDLSTGTHMVTVIATDPSGNEDEVTVVIKVTKASEEEKGLTDIFDLLPPEICIILVLMTFIVLGALMVSARRHRLELRYAEELAAQKATQRARKRRKVRKLGSKRKRSKKKKIKIKKRKKN